MERIGFTASEELLFENVDGRTDGRTDGRRMPAYTISSPMLSWAKNTIYVEANVMNRYAKFQLHPLDDFWEEDFWIFFRKLTLYVAMATNQIQWFGQNSYES